LPVEAAVARKTERRVASALGVITSDANERTTLCEDASVTQQTLVRARAGDEGALRELTDRYRRELKLHSYRIVGRKQE
jgi:hypothetical protein